jgi:arylsulfatase A-like enzyme
VVVLTDDQGCWTLGSAGNAECRTPNLDRLANSGTRFANFFCASPVCSPARASLLTGRIPSQHGIHDWLRAGDTIPPYEEDRNGELIEYLAGQTGYTDLLAAVGYTCALSGKWHLGDSHHAQKGFTYWNVHAKGGGPYYKAPMVDGDTVYEEDRYVTDVITDHALEFLDRQVADAPDTPFYLGIHYTAPHSPWGREQHPAELWDDYHENCPFASAPDGLPPPIWAERLSIPVETPEKRRSVLSGYYAAVTAMDANVGRVLDWLEEHGLRENTLVFFTSDNGMNMGHHGVYGKGNATFPQNMFEESVKVPAIVSRPGSVPEGRVNEDLLSHYDFMPTLLDYLGIANPVAEGLPGTSFAPLLRGEELPAREAVVICDEYGPVRMIRTQSWKYIHRYPYGPHELYDLDTDPGETTNLFDAPEHARTLQQLRKALGDWFLRYVNPERDGTKEPVSGRGQLGLCGADGDGRHQYAP